MSAFLTNCTSAELTLRNVDQRTLGNVPEKRALAKLLQAKAADVIDRLCMRGVRTGFKTDCGITTITLLCCVVKTVCGKDVKGCLYKDVEFSWGIEGLIYGLLCFLTHTCSLLLCNF